MKKVFITAIVLLAAVCSVFAVGGKEGGAVSGGKLVIYSPNSDSEVEAIIPAFEEWSGVTVELLSMGTGECVTRIDSEKANPQADILWGGMNLGVYTTNPDLWEQYVSANDKLLPKAYQSYNGYYTNYVLSGSAALLVNLDVFKELGLDPAKFDGYEDLLWPELKGKIAMGDPTASSSAWAELSNMLLVMGSKPYADDAWIFVEKFIGQLNGAILGSSSAIYKGTSAGEYAVGVSYEDPCVKLLMDGAKNLKVVYPKEGSVWLPAAVAVVKNAPNMDNAKLFVDFLISNEGQKLFADTSVRPANTAVENTSPSMQSFKTIKLAYEDIPLCAKNKKAWQAKWKDLFTK